MIKYKFLSHTADVKFKAFGKNINECFENSAYAVINTMYDGKIKSKLKKQIKLKEKNIESLLYNFLEQILILIDSENFFISKVKIKVDEKNFKLNALFWGDNAKNYNISTDVKAITYNSFFVKKEKGLWICQVILDV
ncbi:MAG TPA: archease [Candidatus Paceibacterota bacterium]|nr:archease [Candidatus Paceibacterota bacterium]